VSLESLIDTLRTGLHHATSVSGYQLILSSGEIRHNDGALPFSFGESRLSNCYDLGAISFFDFETPSSETIFDSISQMKWETVLFRHRPSILLGVRRSELPGELIDYAEAKRRCGLGGIIPHIEVCHVSAIPLSAIFQTVVAARSDTVNFHTDYTFRRYDGFRLPDGDSAEWT
jgi:hypothetical protein